MKGDIKMKTVTGIMNKEHERIGNLLGEFEANLDKDKKTVADFFNTFEWNLQKHLFVEERVIFSAFNPPNLEQDDNDLSNLLKDHAEILSLLEKIRDNIDGDIKHDVWELKNIITAHAEFENEIFYPRLDEELDDVQKQLIFERAEEIIKD
jgi:hemerythrin-like domain-containing protein